MNFTLPVFSVSTEKSWRAATFQLTGSLRPKTSLPAWMKTRTMLVSVPRDLLALPLVSSMFLSASMVSKLVSAFPKLRNLCRNV